MRQNHPISFHLLGLLLLSLWAFLPFAASLPAQTIVVAHRGGSGLGPENTLPTIQKSLEIGVAALEIDIHQTKDSVLVVSHDETLNRCTNGNGRIDAHTLVEIKQLDAGAWFGPEFEGTRVPTLEEVLQVVAGKAEIWIEIKGNAKEYPGLEQRLVDMIRKHDAFEWVQVISFETAALRRIHAMEPKIRLQKLLVSNLRGLPFYLDKRLHFGSVAKLDFVHGYSMLYKCMHRRFARKMEARGKKVNVWTVNQEKKACKLIESKPIGALTTNYPDKVMELMKAR